MGESRCLGELGCLTGWAWGWEVGQSQIVPEPQVTGKQLFAAGHGSFFFGCTTWHVESFFPRPGSELALPALPGRFLIIGSSGKSGGSY